MTKLDLFRLFGKSTPKAEQTDRLTEVDANEQQAYISPIDYTQKLLDNEAKDRRLFGFFENYKPRDYYGRYKNLAFLCLLLTYLFSILSAYLSFPFITQFLADDFPNPNLLWGASLAVVLLNELVKHISMNIAARTVFTYREKPYFSGTLALLALAFSVYACINGISTTSEQDYEANKPTIEQFTSKYDTQIAKAEQEIKELKNNRVASGEIEYNSQKAIARKDKKLTEWRDQAIKEKQDKLDKAVIKYDVVTAKKSTFRQYAGYVIESVILLAGMYWLVFMFKSSFEHSAHINRKFLQSFTPQLPVITPQNNTPAIGFNYGNNNRNKLIFDKITPKKDDFRGDSSQNLTDTGYGVMGTVQNGKHPKQNVTDTDVGEITGDVVADNTPNTKSNKPITNYDYEDLTALLRVNKQRLSAYKWKLKNGKGTDKNNREKIAKYTGEIARLEELQQKYKSDETD